MLRLLLVIAMVNGLVPSFGEALEAVVHYVASGHVAHFESGETDLNTGKEHGCGPTDHHCRCCASQSVIPVVVHRWVLVDVVESPRTPFVHEKVAEGMRARLLRPPISA
ncbi:hypothetical protein CYFUS_000616 [Cystobacter fuscus]|uniref:Uncharacterized protein n=1 Tax=Cystobacter fuscus TaxID=43 RepID=A0A250ITY5_9BACT|nr:hypothetical protein [Cystobacter fuscus]ATB35204.1 hypothetical protein CYFUS_000616 [Cystobacter fuscus]